MENKLAKVIDLLAKRESDPSLKPPKKWWDEMEKEVKEENPDYSQQQVKDTIGDIWYNELSESKRKEIRGREGKTYGPAKESRLHKVVSQLKERAAMKFYAADYVRNAGWGYEDIEATVQAGYVADADVDTIREMGREQGLEGDELEDAVIEACEALMDYCRRVVVAEELLQSIPDDVSDEERADHESIAAQVADGVPISEIHEMDDGQWPGTYDWLRSELGD